MSGSNVTPGAASFSAVYTEFDEVLVLSGDLDDTPEARAALQPVSTALRKQAHYSPVHLLVLSDDLRVTSSGASLWCEFVRDHLLATLVYKSSALTDMLRYDPRHPIKGVLFFGQPRTA